MYSWFNLPCAAELARGKVGSAHNNGMSSGSSSLRGFPLTLSVIMASLIAFIDWL